jgi:hypothetical protein
MTRVSLRILGVLATLMFAISVQAQTGQISGAVTDPKGAMVHGARVQVTNQNTGAEGTYTVAGLSAGQYRITVKAQGFATDFSEPILLRVDQSQSFNAQLRIGSTTSSVEVRGTTDSIINANPKVLQSRDTPRMDNLQSDQQGSLFRKTSL